ncbi:MAG: polysaccharide deacetylase family protein [Oligoflexia bacterium]|nr:polysaccharide deacetylase family protein [Oligoflexia bacterium]
MVKLLGSILSLTITSSLACGVHQNLGAPYKQFVEDDIIYNSDNSDHRGWAQYLAKSLHQSNKVVLTYDDGPHPETTPQLLDTLKEHGVKATFFAVASRIEAFPEIAQRIVNEGHILASHDYTHINSNTRSESEYFENLEKSILVVKNFYNQKHAYYRFPYGAYGRNKTYHQFNVMRDVGKKLFNENCINFAFWDIDTADWVSNMEPKDIAQTIDSHIFGGTAYRFVKKSVGGKTKYVKEAFEIDQPVGGGVILMHDIHQRTIDATKIFLKELKNKNVIFETLDQVDEYQYFSKVCELVAPLF